MKNTILGIQVTPWTVNRVSKALKDTKRKPDSWHAGYSTARAEMEVLNEYQNGIISVSQSEILLSFLRNITINYGLPIRESLYTHEIRRKKNH